MRIERPVYVAQIRGLSKPATYDAAQMCLQNVNNISHNFLFLREVSSLSQRVVTCFTSAQLHHTQGQRFCTVSEALMS